MKLRTLIVEDHKDARDLLIFLCEPIHEIEIIGAVGDLTTAKLIVEEQHPDLIFLDVALKGGDGFELLAVLDRKAYPFSLIFTTANPEHAIKAIKEAADDYLLKPISSTELRKSVSNVIQKKYYLTKGKKNILISSIVYIRSRGNHVEYHCDGRTQPYVERGSLSALLESLPSVQFVRVHRSFIVNRSHILEVNQSSLLLTKIQRIPVGETYLGAI